MSRRKYSRSRLEALAAPRHVSPYFIPDRISVYWLDYIPDPKPHKITNPVTLLNYYKKCREKFPRTDRLAEERPWPEYGYDYVERPTTAYGIPVSALSYKPTERIRKLSTPIIKEEGIGLVSIKHPPRTPFSSKSRTPTYFGQKNKLLNQTPDLLSTGDFQSRSRFHRSRPSTSGKNIPQTAATAGPSNVSKVEDRNNNLRPPTSYLLGRNVNSGDE